ncbi:unnamed protein product [Schistocephalus solidus]|uniref:DUF2263 domain-containing protein n=1 Tax=Schistocephalus solidus TaxID=70667 RepID=A0A183TFA9_SCHSO|nr:unnamed protein product [Schistocephalus solidus]
MGMCILLYRNSETLPNASEVIGPTKLCCSSDVHAVGRFCSDSNSSVNYKNDYPDKALVLRPRIFTVSAAVYSSQNRSTEYDPYDSYAAYRGHGLFLSEAVTTAANGLKDIAPVDLCPTDPGYAQESSVEFGDYDYGCLRASTDEEVSTTTNHHHHHHLPHHYHQHHLTTTSINHHQNHHQHHQLLTSSPTSPPLPPKPPPAPTSTKTTTKTTTSTTSTPPAPPHHHQHQPPPPP